MFVNFTGNMERDGMGIGIRIRMGMSLKINGNENGNGSYLMGVGWNDETYC